MHLLLTNIKQLCQIETGTAQKQNVKGAGMKVLPSIENAWLFIENGLIHSFGPMSEPPMVQANDVIDMSGRLVLPAWCDSHTHIVFAAPREQEFVDRINGLTYEDIAKRGGGILNSARRLNETDEEFLYEQSLKRCHEVIRQGTGALEIKSGYGLTLEGELKMLRVIRRLKENLPIPVKATFLGAHAYPTDYKENKKGYIKLIIDEMLPRIVDEGLADYIDAFCEEGFFNTYDTERIIDAGIKYNLKAKIHANQLHYSGGVQLGVRKGAVSVDHLEHVEDNEINALKEGTTIPTLLPGAAFFLGMQYQPARKLIDAGLPVCLATDYNPGSCPSGNVPLLLTIACTQLRMTPEEAINSVTLNGAAAMELQHEVGTIAVGKKANLIVTHPMDSVAYIPYNYGNNPVERMILNGVFF
jgi:imidazolonepropionase